MGARKIKRMFEIRWRMLETMIEEVLESDARMKCSKSDDQMGTLSSIVNGAAIADAQVNA